MRAGNLSDIRNDSSLRFRKDDLRTSLLRGHHHHHPPSQPEDQERENKIELIKDETRKGTRERGEVLAKMAKSERKRKRQK